MEGHLQIAFERRQGSVYGSGTISLLLDALCELLTKTKESMPVGGAACRCDI